MWTRVFALNDAAPEPEALAAYLRKLNLTVEIKIDADDQGWFHIELVTSAGVYIIDRYLADEGIRDDLNTWAAWLEENAGDRADALMQRMIATRQLITMRRDDRGSDTETTTVCRTLARLVAERSDGIYQVDGEGFFAANGEKLVAEV